MSYIEEQRKKAIKLRNDIFKDPGGGVFKQTERDFVLKEAPLNLWAGIREDAIEYFTKYGITFWDSGDEPTGHLLSSQIACLNHLYFIRQREDVATIILRSIDKNVKSALRMDNGTSDSGYVDFEVIGRENYLGEKSHTRGTNSTSVDAVMLAEMDSGQRKLIFIEWKYVEKYGGASKATDDGGPTRLKIYTPFLVHPECPLNISNVEGLFTEPYYQLMRQTLLANEMVKAKEYGATDYLHLHVIPTANKELKDVNTAEGKLEGKSLIDTWVNILKTPEKYKVVDPKEFISPMSKCSDTRAIFKYLQQRYWD